MKHGVAFVVATAGSFLLAACGTTHSGGGPVTVQGTVVGLVGSPLPSASVSIGSVTTTTSDATSAFSIANVTPPYDATVSSVSGNLAHVYEGLSTATPTLFPVTALGGGVAITSSATFAGTVTTSVAASGTHRLVVCVDGVTQEVYGGSTYTSPTTATTVDYSLSVAWRSTANVAVRVHAVRYARASATDLPSSYYGYAKTASSTTLVPGTTCTSINLSPFGAMGSNALSGTVSVPAGYTSAQVLLMVRVSPTLSIPLGGTTSAAPLHVQRAGSAPTYVWRPARPRRHRCGGGARS